MSAAKRPPLIEVPPTFSFGPLDIDVANYGSEGSAVLGIKGSGKTFTATLLAEKLHAAGIPFIAFDPIGVWRYLRVPGAGPGIPVVVAGGTDGDLALTPATAPAIVEAAMQTGVSLVIDLFSIHLSKADWRRIVRDVVKLLVHKNAPFGLRHVFIEEAAEFIPQRVIEGDVYAAVEQLARIGGNARLGYTLINQRSEEVNKAVLELCDNLFLHRQKGRNSLTALGKWLDIGNVTDSKGIVSTLASLPTGECWAWMAGSDTPVRVKVPAKNSYHPDRRVMRGAVALVDRAAVDVGAFVAQLRASLPKIAEEAKAADPKALRSELARLNAEITRLSAALGSRPDDATIQGWRDKSYSEGLAAGRADLLVRVAKIKAGVGVLQERAEALATLAQNIAVDVIAPNLPLRSDALLPARIAEISAPNVDRAALRAAHEARTAPTLPTLGRKLLDVLVQRAPARLTWSQTTQLAGLMARGGSFNAGRKALRESGLIDEAGGQIWASETAIARFGDAAGPPMSPAETLEMWCQRLPTPAPEMLRALATDGPMSGPDLADRLGRQPRGGSWNSGVAVLRNNGLIVIAGGLMRLSEIFEA